MAEHADESTPLTGAAIPKLRFEVSGVTEEGTRTLLFVHGWPDNEHTFFLQTSYFAPSYRIVTVRLPWFGTIQDAEDDAARFKHSRAGYSFRELAEGLVNVCLEIALLGPITCVSHDWGAILAQMAELARPGLFDSMICIDVALVSWMLLGPRWSMRSIFSMLFAGFIYQWPAALGYLLYDRLPSIAGWFGSGMARKMARKALWERPLVKALCEQDHEARAILDAHPAHAGMHPLCGFVYAQFHRAFWGGLFSRLFWRSTQPIVPEGTQLSHWTKFPKCPLLFAYGSEMMDFHSKAWEHQVLLRGDGSQVLEYPDSGHWVQIEKAEGLNLVIETWLKTLNSNDKCEEV